MASLGEICSREVVIAERDTSVAAAARLMRQHHVGSIVVVEPMAGDRRAPVGIVTDRDLIVEVMAVNLDPSVITLGDIMEANLATAPESGDILEALEVMRGRGVRRLPIVGAGGELIGIATFDDLLEVLAEELNSLARTVAREQSRETVSRK